MLNRVWSWLSRFRLLHRLKELQGLCDNLKQHYEWDIISLNALWDRIEEFDTDLTSLQDEAFFHDHNLDYADLLHEHDSEGRLVG